MFDNIIKEAFRVIISILVAVVFNIINTGDREALTEFSHNDGLHHIKKRSADLPYNQYSNESNFYQFCYTLKAEISSEICLNDPNFICCQLYEPDVNVPYDIDLSDLSYYLSEYDKKKIMMDLFRYYNKFLHKSKNTMPKSNYFMKLSKECLEVQKLIKQKSLETLKNDDDFFYTIGKFYAAFDGVLNNQLTDKTWGSVMVPIKKNIITQKRNEDVLPEVKVLANLYLKYSQLFRKKIANYYPPILGQLGIFIKEDIIDIIDNKCGEFNNQTAYLDASNIYGTNKTNYKNLSNTYYFPPLVDENSETRRDDLLWIGYMRMIWQREHNRIADILRKLNTNTANHKIHLMARKIANAELQHIVYNEWLPLLLGVNAMKKFKLFSKNDYETGYKSFLNPEISDTFSLITQDFSFKDIINPYYTNNNNDKLKFIENNLLLGRKLKVPSYNEVRQYCGLKRINSFDELPWRINDELQKLLNLFVHPDNIDLYLGLIAEDKLLGSLFGPTANCIIAEQFLRLKYGDRFWYENNKFVNSFTLEQLNQIKQVTLRRIVCDNDPFAQNVTSFPLLPPYNWNKIIDCKSPDIAQVNLKPWTNVL